MDKELLNAPVLVIGLGRFGAGCADQLVRLGREVLVVENDAETVQEWAEKVTHIVQADAKNIEALRQVGAADFKIAVIGIGTSIEASILVVSNLLELGVQEIWAKALSPTHGKIMQRLGVKHVIYPESEGGERVAHLVTGSMLDFIEFGDDYVMAKMYPPKSIQGMRLGESEVRSKHRVTVVGVKVPGKPFANATEETIVGENDIIVVSGAPMDVERFAVSA